MKITGTGSSLPKRTITNEMLEEFMDTSDKWIRERTGISQRQLISDEDIVDLAADASQKAMDDAGITAGDIDYIICSNVVNEYVTPSIASMVEGRIGADCPCVDLNAACTGFIYAIDMADALLQTNRAKNILILCAEEPSRMVDWKDRSTCVLFGDGAGAIIATQGNDLKAIKVSSKSMTDVLFYKRILEPTPFISKEEEVVPLYMRGKEVFKMAVNSSINDLEEVLNKSDISKDEIKYYVLHQANFRILDFIRTHLKVDTEKLPYNVDRYGNTSSASVPILLDELHRSGKLTKGDKLAFSAFGAGFTSGACVIEWSK